MSLGALTALGACGDDVTVPVAPAAPVTISITPPSATMNVGERLNFAVQIGGGSTTAAPTLASCTSSNTAVVTTTVSGSACAVTAVAPGNATITAAASTGQAAAAGVTVAAPAASISGMTVSPSAAQLAVGQTVTIVPNVTKAAASVNVTYTYTSSSATVATVSAAGVVTAVAPGTATITITAAGTGTGFSAATLTSATTITVSDRAPGLTSLQVSPATVTMGPGSTSAVTAVVQGPRASAATYSYGTSAPSVATVTGTGAAGTITAVAPGTATITVTAQSTQDGAFSASSITGLVTVTVTPAAQVVISSLTQGGAIIDINNVRGQIEVNAALSPNGQTITAVQAWVCVQGETVAQCAARTNGEPAAQQTFTAAGAQSANVQMYVNTAEFKTPNFTTGADANTLYKNGLKTIVATLTTTSTAASTIASNSISSVNFNNTDSWTIQWTQPTNKALDATGITWYGGPATPDALVANATSGTSSFVVVPVMYTQQSNGTDRTINEVTLNITGLSCGSNIRDRSRPFGGSFGALTRDTMAVAFACAGSASDANGVVPAVISSIDDNNAAGPTATGGTPTAATSIFNSFAQTGTGASPTNGRYRGSLAYNPATIYIPMDYQAPTVTNFDVRGGGGSGVNADSGWVNAAYAFDQRTSLGAQLRYQITDGSAGSSVGLLTSRNTVFDVCATPSPISATAATTCASPVGSGGLSATVGSMNLPEAADLTNRAYFVIARETDRLGNRRTTNPFTYQTSPLVAAVSATAGNQTFGVDLTAPALVAIPNSSTTPGATIAGFARTDRDSIYASGTPRFAVRFTDSRSGFPNCAATTCVNAANQRAGTFSITRRMRPTLDSYTNDALVEGLINWELSSQATLTRSIDAGLYVNDNTVREWAIDYFGEAARALQTTAAPTGEGSYQPGYYTFAGSLVDRAGNSTAIPTRSIAMDQQAPVLSALSPRQLASGSPVVADATGSDDLEVIAGDLSLTYPIGTVVFHRTPALTATAKLGFWHNPFASVTDNKLTTIIGTGTALGATPLQTPIGLLSQITQVDGGFAPLAPAAIVGTGKPTAIIGQLHDIRSTVTRSSSIGATQFADSGASNRLSVVISASQLANNTKNWGETTVAGYASPVGIQQWYMFDPANSSTTVEYRARTNTSVTNPPFAKVHVIRRNANTPAEWDYLGDANYVGVVDQGGARFFRWTFTGGSSEQGQYSIASIADQDNLIAIGADNAGVGLATQASLLGVAPLPAVFTTETVVVTPAFNAAPAFSQFTNSSGQFTRALSPSANPQSANLAYTCASSNATFMTATMGANGVCTLTPVGTVSAAAGVKVALTFTIAGTPSSSPATHRAATITKTDTILRMPDAAPVAGISAVAVGGAIPASMLPGASFTLTATPTQPAGAPTATYNWTAAPAGFTATGTTTNSATYTWTGAQSYTGSLTINVVASTAAAAGFTSASSNGSATQAALLGYTDQDAGFGGALTPATSTIGPVGTQQLTMTPAGSSNPTQTTLQSCSSSATGNATVSSTGLVTGANPAVAGSTNVTCVVSRAQHSFGGGNYAARTISTNTVVVNVELAAITAVAVGGTIPATLLPGQSFTLTATPTQPAPAAAATYSWTAAPAGFTATSTTASSITYTWTGAQSRTGSLTLGVTASAAASAGYSAASASNSTTTAAVDGFQNQDGFGGAMTPANIILNASATQQLTLTPLGTGDPTQTTFACTSNRPGAANVSGTGLITAAAVVAPDSAQISCTVSRPQHTFGGQNYAAMGPTATNIVRVTVVVPVPAITSVATGGTIPAALQPGDQFTLTATPTLPAGNAGATVNYTWDPAPAGFTATGLNTASATYTWVGDLNGGRPAAALTLNVSAQVAASAGFSAATQTSFATNAAVTGYWNTDTYTFTATPSQLVLDPQTTGTVLTGSMSYTNNIVSDPASNSYSCTESSAIINITNAATGAYETTMGGDAFLVPQTATITCDMTRTFHLFGGVPYAARTGATKATTTATVNVRPNSVQSVAFASASVNMAAGGGTATVATSRTVATTPGGLTYDITYDAVAYGGTGSANLPGAGTVSIDAAGLVTITTTGATTTGTYAVKVKLTGAGSAGLSFGNNKTTTVDLSVVVP